MGVGIKGNQAAILAILFFASAWIYGLMYYWDNSTQVTGLDERDAETASSSTLEILTGAIEFFSWTSPFMIVKGAIYMISPPPLYEFLNLFILRPLGWLCSYFFLEWVIFTIRGIT